MAPTEFSIVNLPKLQPKDYMLGNKLIRQIAEKNRTLRLRALKTSPEAFGSSYETEIERGVDQTIERLKLPQANHFFAMDKPIIPWSSANEDSFFQDLLQAEWVGMVVLIGPLTNTGSHAISSKRDPLAPYDRGEPGTTDNDRFQEDVLHYHMNGVYVEPRHRGLRLGSRLIEAALSKASAAAADLSRRMHCTILVDAENLIAHALYQKLGFRAVAREPYVQQPRLHMGEMKTSERIAVKMEICLNKLAE